MAKKDLKKVQVDLSALADTLPTQKVGGGGRKGRVSSAPTEELLQFSFSMRKSLRKELMRIASEADVTMRAFVLSALRAKGLSVTDADLLDLRKRG